MRTEELQVHRQEEISYQNHHLVHSWDFELLLMELRRNPVLHGVESKDLVYLLDEIASA